MKLACATKGFSGNEHTFVAANPAGAWSGHDLYRLISRMRQKGKAFDVFLVPVKPGERIPIRDNRPAVAGTVWLCTYYHPAWLKGA